MANAISSSKTGLLDLADELLLEIISHYPCVSAMELSSEIDQQVRRDALSSLSRTCRKLWGFFRPFIWNNVEVYEGMQILSGTARLPTGYPGSRRADQAPFYYELYRQLDIVTDDRSLSERVR